MTKISGRCLCGNVTFQSPGPVLWSGICHCESCRRATSAPCTSFFGVPRKSITWTGLLGQNATSQGTVRRLFCPDCGSQLAYQSDRWPDESHLYTNALDDPNTVPPNAHFHYAERVPWLKIIDDLPKHPGSAEDA